MEVKSYIRTKFLKKVVVESLLPLGSHRKGQEELRVPRASKEKKAFRKKGLDICD